MWAGCGTMGLCGWSGNSLFALQILQIFTMPGACSTAVGNKTESPNPDQTNMYKADGGIWLILSGCVIYHKFNTIPVESKKNTTYLCNISCELNLGFFFPKSPYASQMRQQHPPTTISSNVLLITSKGEDTSMPL